MAAVQGQDRSSPNEHGKPPPALNTLPSEMRKLIVSHLAPGYDTLRPGCKKDLKSANLTHSCLRAWVPEYMFRDMALKHVLMGLSSHLECFAVDPKNAELLKFVKHINVQIPPAVRWEIGTNHPMHQPVEEITVRRLCSKFGVRSTTELTEEKRQYAGEFYQAMIEPFSDNRSWYRLLRCADRSWGQVFRRFPKLEAISVGCCEIVDHPAPTYTHTFVLEHGRDVMSELHPPYAQDSAVNMAWASSIVLKAAPPWVRHFQLSMANTDNFNTFATVNRLLTMIQRWSIQPQLANITSLCLNIRGIAGTHGSSDWAGETGSAGSVRHWTKALNSVPELRHLELRDEMEVDSALRFSGNDMSDLEASVLEWILPELTLKRLRTLRLSRFSFDKTKVLDMFPDIWPCLETLILEDITLIMRDAQDTIASEEHQAHLEGASWVDACRWLVGDRGMPHVRVIRPTMRIHGLKTFMFSDGHWESITELPHVDVQSDLRKRLAKFDTEVDSSM